MTAVCYDATMLEPSSRQKKLEDKLNAYYFSLANIESLGDKEREKLYKDIERTIEHMSTEEEKAKEWARFLSDSGDELKARMKDTINSEKKSFIISRAPANGTIDYREEKANHFARGLNGYKLFLVLFVGAFSGVIVEMLWCFVRHGYIESRAGLVYGPFNLVYGFGALCLTAGLYEYRNRGAVYSFLGGFITGSVVEYICSFVQEKLFGSASWDYSNVPLNINGRICLLYSIFWGFLGVFWIKSVYPRFSVWVLKIPNKIGKIIVWILLVFMIFDSVVSGLAVYRWSERVDGKAPNNSIERILDSRFPDSRMERIFPNMEFLGE